MGNGQRSLAQIHSHAQPSTGQEQSSAAVKIGGGGVASLFKIGVILVL